MRKKTEWEGKKWKNFLMKLSRNESEIKRGELWEKLCLAEKSPHLSSFPLCYWHLPAMFFLSLKICTFTSYNCMFSLLFLLWIGPWSSFKVCTFLFTKLLVYDKHWSSTKNVLHMAITSLTRDFGWIQPSSLELLSPSSELFFVWISYLLQYEEVGAICSHC